MTITANQAREDICRLAIKQIGNEEDAKHQNTGPIVMQYQAATTLKGTRWPWCAALMAWLIRKVELGRNIDLPWSYSASCDEILRWAKNNHCLYASPQVGDVFLVMNDDNPNDATHTGLVIELLPNGKFKTVEGNTNSNGGREGYEVASHERENSNHYKFVRFLEVYEKNSKEFIFKVLIGNNTLYAPQLNSVGYVRIDEWAKALGFKYTWNSVKQTPVFNGRDIGVSYVMSNGNKYAPLRKLALYAGLTLVFNKDKNDKLDGTISLVRVTKGTLGT